MDPEENVDVEVEVTEEVTPEEQVKNIALDVADKAKMVESGEMTVADFVADIMEQLGNVEVAGESMEASPMGGLGAGAGNFPNLEDLESEA